MTELKTHERACAQFAEINAATARQLKDANVDQMSKEKFIL